MLLRIAGSLAVLPTLALWGASTLMATEAPDRAGASSVDATGAAAVAERSVAGEGPIRTRAELEAATPRSENPYLHFLPPGVVPDWRYWTAKVQFDSWDRAAADPGSVPRGAPIGESEPNDTFATADPLPGLVAGGGPIQISGATDVLSYFFPVDAGESPPFCNDTFDDATSVSLTSGILTPVEAFIGDCSPTASDVDYYSFYLAPGDIVSADVDVDASAPDTWAILYGEYPYSVLDLAFSDPNSHPPDPDPYVSATAPVWGEYWLAVRSTSGIGSYEVLIGKNSAVDLYAVELEAGDVLGVASDLVADLSILGPDERERYGSSRAVSDLYPADSPLPRSATGSDVARETGTHYLRVKSLEQFATPYELTAQVFRPGSEGSEPQTLFLDFDGATINADALFDSGPGYISATLSPLSTFLGGWGLAPSDQSAVISEILEAVTENFDDLAAVNPAFSYELLNSRDHADPFGQPGVSRVIVGGTQEQLGRETIGVASSIDPGNFDLEDTAVVLLDRLSGSAGTSGSLNQFTIAPGHAKIDLVGMAVGNIVSHEIGHFLGSFHTEWQNNVYALVDSGGDLAHIFGSNDDVFGDSDDQDVDFAEDLLTAGSGLKGVEDQAGRTAFALMGDGVLFADGFESGGVTNWD